MTTRRGWMVGVGGALAALVGWRAEASAPGLEPPPPLGAQASAGRAGRGSVGSRAGRAAVTPTARCGAGEAERL